MKLPLHASAINLRNSVLACIITLTLVGCQRRETPVQLQAWLDLQNNRSIAAPAELPATPLYHSFIYQAGADSVPFGRHKPMTPEIFSARPAQRTAAQPLEDFPLASIQMVGTISQQGRRHVLLQVDKLVYQAREGDYAGQNFGVIRHISDSEISLEELIPGSDGRWEQRMATLPLRGMEK